MDKYYYMVSQLPALAFDKETYYSVNLFLEEAEKWTSKKDYKLLSGIHVFDISREGPLPAYIQSFQSLEYNLRREIADWRKSVREGQEVKLEILHTSMVKEGDPLQVEKKLLSFRWETIEDLEQEHHFDMAFLVYYLYKLQILEHLARFDKSRGLEVFQEVIE